MKKSTGKIANVCEQVHHKKMLAILLFPAGMSLTKLYQTGKD
jgi:hypothetical protein